MYYQIAHYTFYGLLKNDWRNMPLNSILNMLPPEKTGHNVISGDQRQAMQMMLKRPIELPVKAAVIVSHSEAEKWERNQIAQPMAIYQPGFYVVLDNESAVPDNLFMGRYATHFIEYANWVRSHNDAYEAWRNGRSGFHQSEVPAGLDVSNHDRGFLETWDFKFLDYSDPRPYTAYVSPNPGYPETPGRGWVKGWMGNVIGNIDYIAGTPSRGGFGAKFKMVEMTDMNGIRWYARWYFKSQDCANFRQKKGQ